MHSSYACSCIYAYCMWPHILILPFFFTALCRHRHHSPHHHKLYRLSLLDPIPVALGCLSIAQRLDEHIPSSHCPPPPSCPQLKPRATPRTQQLESKSKYTGHLGMCCLNVTPACDNNRWLASYAGSGRVPPFVGVCSADDSEDEGGDFVLRLSS